MKRFLLATVLLTLAACGGRSGPRSGNVLGSALTLAKDNSAQPHPLGTSNDFTKVVIAGKEYRFSNEPILGAGGYRGDEKAFINENLQYARFGFFTYDNTPYVFAQGNESRHLPSRGVARYLGQTVSYNPGDQSRNFGSFRATVDFGRKELAARLFLPERSQQVYEIGGVKITHNAFSGKNNALELDGHFYGYQGAEMAGVYSLKGEKSIGALGARKQ